VLNLREQIELRRAEMNHLAEQYGLPDQRVLEESQEMDKLINKYERNKVKLKGKKPSSILEIRELNNSIYEDNNVSVC
jgi:hypothetical protein